MAFVLPKYSSFLEDDVNVNVNVGADGDDGTVDALDQVSEVESDSADAADTSSEIDDVANSTEQMFSTLDRALAVKSYIAQNGIDQRLLMLQDYDGFITSHNGLNVAIYGTESYSSRSSEAYAAMEDIGQMASDAWEWIKKMCRRIKDLVRELVAKFLNIFSGYKKQCKRLRSLMKNRIDKDKSDVEDKTVSGWNPDNASNTTLTTLKGIRNGLDTVINYHYTADNGYSELSNIDEDKWVKGIEAPITKINDLDYELDDLDADNALDKAGKALTKAEEIANNLNDLERHRKTIDRNATEISRTADNTKNDENKVKDLKVQVRYLNLVTQLLAKYISAQKRVCGIWIKTASGFISKGTISKTK